ncbi:XAC2610-related protein [Acinetobacter piscicola]|uniref:XAC2610-related protein n=1 Tax=Acinetobacter piscicola TaxID=2006115 RepID=UPI0038993DE8
MLSQNTIAQIFEIKKASKHYDVVIDVPCDRNECGGQAKIDVYKKGQTKKFQHFLSTDLTTYLGKDFKPSVNVVQLYGEQSPLIFDDFNFDGQEDIAIRNGNEGAYGGPTYDIYIFNRTRNKFVFSDELSALTHENLGMFKLDADKKRILTFNKSGCCYHIRSEYVVVPQKGLRLVKEFIEDATVAEGDKVKVTERTLNKGRWVENTKYYPIKQYYKD